MREIATAHCEVAEMLARQLGLPENIQETLRYSLEQWDGKGKAYGLKSEDVPIASRILHIAQVLGVAHSFGGVSAAVAIAGERRGTDFDPELVDQFREESERTQFWQVLDQESVKQTVLEMAPATPFDEATEETVDAVCEVMADFTDIAAPGTWNHSRNVADVTVDICRQMGLGQGDVTELRRAALVHDLGKVAVPSAVLQKNGDLSDSEREEFRQHSYYTERILSRVDRLSPLASEAGSHHEWLNGHGYHRELLGEQIPMGGRWRSRTPMRRR